MAKFQTAFAITIDDNHESSRFQKDPGDSGNWTGGEVGKGELKGTKYGISAAQYPELDIENMTADQAASIYRETYWKQHYSDIESQPVANKLFDMGVLFWVATAVKVLQTVLSIPADGVFGPDTVAHVNGADPVSLLAAFKTGMVTHATAITDAKPEKRKYWGGWVRRINDTTGEN